MEWRKLNFDQIKEVHISKGSVPTFSRSESRQSRVKFQHYFGHQEISLTKISTKFIFDRGIQKMKGLSFLKET